MKSALVFVVFCATAVFADFEVTVEEVVAEPIVEEPAFSVNTEPVVAPVVEVCQDCECKAEQKRLYSSITTKCAGNTCFPNRQDFVDYCWNTYQGVPMLYRCFFHNPTLTNWDDAWAACRSRGGTLAQIQSAYEERSLHQLASGVPEKRWWVGMRTHLGGTKWTAGLNLQSTVWHESLNSYFQAFLAGRNWLRNFKYVDRTTNPNEYCWVYATYGSDMMFLDHDCSIPSPALCYIPNDVQKFDMFDVCIGEMMFKDIPGKTVTECAQECAGHHQCRGFNYNCLTKLCQLTSWDIQDKPNLSTVPGCTYYKVVW